MVYGLLDHGCCDGIEPGSRFWDSGCHADASECQEPCVSYSSKSLKGKVADGPLRSKEIWLYLQSRTFIRGRSYSSSIPTHNKVFWRNKLGSRVRERVGRGTKILNALPQLSGYVGPNWYCDIIGHSILRPKYLIRNKAQTISSREREDKCRVRLRSECHRTAA